jgi:TonB-dependent SusC/RagA subfamily outer membrane receptor
MQRITKHVLGVLSLFLMTPVVASAQVPVTAAEPIVIVNGIVVSNSVTVAQAIGRISPDSIESVSIIKGAAALELYGARATGGVILIRTKGHVAANEPPVTEQQRRWAELLKQLSTPEPVQATPRPRPLIVVDGVIIGRGDPGSLDVLKERIESVSVLRGAAATTAYGAAGADGVIVIKTK